jgi:integrase/recombinase XerD
MLPIKILDTRTQIKEGPNKGRYAVKVKARIPVYVNGKKEWIPKNAKTGVYATEAEFKSIIGSPRAADLKAKRDLIDKVYRKAEDVCKIDGLTPEQYVRLVEGAGNFESITGLFDWKIAELEKEGLDGNAIAVRNARSSFIAFKGGDYISYAEVTVDWLERYKKWMMAPLYDKDNVLIREARTSTTVYMYCRALRAIMNLAAEVFKKISKESIPFGKTKFKLPSSKKGGRKVKLPLSKDQMILERNKILTYQDSDKKKLKAVNYWRISYFCNGCNPADIAYLKVKNFDAKRMLIIFERKKTENTEEDNDPIYVYVGEEFEQIINQERNRTMDPEAYLFPILSPGMASMERKKTILQFIRVTNKWLKRAAKDMKLEVPFTSGTARYFTSTILKRHGVEMSTIKNMLGHASEETTEHYADGFDIDAMKKVYQMLIAG